MSDNNLQIVICGVNKGSFDKAEAVRTIKNLTGCGLTEAKQGVEDVESGMTQIISVVEGVSLSVAVSSCEMCGFNVVQNSDQLEELVVEHVRRVMQLSLALDKYAFLSDVARACDANGIGDKKW